MKGVHATTGASWDLRVFVGHDPVTGKQRYANKTVRGGRREAQRAFAEMVTESERGLMMATKVTVGS